jgi:hypothetical protein
VKPLLGVLLRLLALVQGCAPRGPLELSAPSLSPAAYAALEAAAADWNTACGEELVHVSRDPGGTPVAEEPGPTFPADGVPQGVYGLTHSSTDAFGARSVDWIHFVPDNGFAEYTAAHEIGHALGIVDHEPEGIMSIHHEDDVGGKLPPGLIGSRQCAEVRGR